MPKYFVDIHILQSLPPSNINRDDAGRPKTAVFGGVTRARVSSQSWKRAVRRSFEQLISDDERAVRTLRAVEVLTPLIKARRPEWSDEQSQERAVEVLKQTGITLEVPKKKPKDGEEAKPVTSQYLLFLSRHQLNRLADVAAADLNAISKKDAKEAVGGNHGIEVSLFGRMVADATDLKVDASVQVAHALSTHAVDIESDYFTAVDDYKEAGDDAGAGMIGYIDFDSSTLYRFATVDLTELATSLGSAEVAAKAASAFVEGFATAMPTGKQNTFGNNTLPEALLVQIRKGRSASFVNAFETAVPRSDAGYLKGSADALSEHCQQLEASFLGKAQHSFLTRASDRAAALDAIATPQPLITLVTAVEAAAAESLGVLP